VTRRGLVLFILMSLIWGIPYLFIRIAVAEITPATLVFCRTALASLILLPLAFARNDIRPVLPRWRWVVAFAAVEVGGPWILLGNAEQHVTSSLAALLVAGVPLVSVVIAVTTGGHERVNRRGLAGLLIGLAGVAAIVGSNLGVTDGLAFVEMAFVVLGYAVGPAILARRLSGAPPVGVQSMALSLCALAYAPVAFVQRPATLPSGDVLAAILILAVVCTAAAFVFFSFLIDEIGPVRSTVVTYINPAVATALGILVLGESVTLAMVAGLVMVILGSILATRGGVTHAPASVVELAGDAAIEVSEVA
jgi:drug/metabolite transporter (DMT)-like permease